MLAFEIVFTQNAHFSLLQTSHCAAMVLSFIFTHLNFSFVSRSRINTVIFRLDRHILRWKAFRTHFNEAEWIVSALVFLLGKRQKLATTNLTQTHVHTQSIPKSIPRHWQRCKSHINYFQASTQRENTFYVGCNFGGDNLCFGVCLVLWRVAAAIYGHAVHFYNL